MTTNHIGKKIKERREELGLTQDELAVLVGYTSKNKKCSINKIETGKNDITRKRLKLFSDVLNIPLAELMEDWDKTVIEGNKTLPTTSLPILGSVAAGTGAYTDNDIIGYEEIPSSWINPNEQYVILIVEGDSMYPKFEDGDKVLVKVQSSVDSGDYGIVLIDGDSAVIKKIAYDDNTIELISANPMYPTRRFENEDVLNLRVFGLVKKSWRSY